MSFISPISNFNSQAFSLIMTVSHGQLFATYLFLNKENNISAPSSLPVFSKKLVALGTSVPVV